MNDIKRRKALVLAGGIPQIELLQSLKELGFCTILADYTEHPVAEPFADIFYRESTLDVSVMRKIAKEESVDLIITCCTDQALATVSLLSEELGLPCYVSAEVGHAVTNKAFMKTRLAEYDIPTAEFKIVSDFDDAKEIEYPCVVKPADCNSSKGVVKVLDDDSLREAIAEARKMSRTGGVIVEKFMEGVEISADCFVSDGIASVLCVSRSDKINHGDGFVICRGAYEPRLHSSYNEEIGFIAQRIVEAFGINEGPLLIQLIASDGSNLNVVEFSARTGGCIKHRLIELSSGVDVIGATVSATLGLPYEIDPHMSDKLIVDEFVYCIPGVFGSIVGFDDAMSQGLISDYHILKVPGTRFDGIANSGDRAVALTIIADDFEDYAEKLLHFVEVADVLNAEGGSMMRKDLLVADASRKVAFHAR